MSIDEIINEVKSHEDGSGFITTEACNIIISILTEYDQQKPD